MDKDRYAYVNTSVDNWDSLFKGINMLQCRIFNLKKRVAKVCNLCLSHDKYITHYNIFHDLTYFETDIRYKHYITFRKKKRPN